MDTHSVLKKLRDQSTYLINREKELVNQLENIKQLKAQNAKREVAVAELEKQLAQELADL
jgi:hypothetical protein